MITDAYVPQADDQDDQQEVALLRRELTSILSVVLLLTGFFTTMLVPPDYTRTWVGPFSVFFFLLIQGIIAFYLRERRPLISQIVLVVGPTISFVGALRTMQGPAVAFYGALIVVANFALGPISGLVAVLLNSVALLAFYRTSPLFLPTIVFLWAITGLAWLPLRGFYRALAWSRHAQQRAAQLLAQLRNHQGELNRALKALNETTERLQLVNRELLIARQEAEEARSLKEQFVANVSHELRTPLNLVVGFAQMMYLDPDGYEGVTWTPELVSDLGELYRAAQHLQSLVGDILDLSRIDATRLPMFREMQPLRPIIAETLETIAPLMRQRGLQYEMRSPDDLPQVFIDRTRVRQVLLNLLNNAIRFTESGSISVQVATGEEAVTVSIHDTGVGIPAEQLDKLFERFHQGEAGLRSAGGTGLGLALSRQFVELHGGRLWAESSVGAGSTFYFSIPLPGKTPHTPELRQVGGPTPHRQSSAPLIVVDPDPSITEMLGRYLEDRRTIWAHNAAEVEQLIFQERPAGVIVNRPPDQAQDSWVGPIGELTRRHSIPIVRCSIPSPSWLTRSSGIDDCLTKPVSTETLRRAVLSTAAPKTVLIVDDDPGFVSLMSRMLRSLAFRGTILAAYTGNDALRLAQERQPDLILLDLLLPDMDGFQVAAALRTAPVTDCARVIAVTATSYAAEALRHHGGHLTITRSAGLSTGTVVDLINAIFTAVRPDYAADEST